MWSWFFRGVFYHSKSPKKLERKSPKINSFSFCIVWNTFFDSEVHLLKHDFLKSQWQWYDPTRSNPNRLFIWLFQKSWSSELTSEKKVQIPWNSAKSPYFVACDHKIWELLTVGVCKCCSVQRRRNGTPQAGYRCRSAWKKTHRRWWMIEKNFSDGQG